jgi:hypothetical protein
MGMECTSAISSSIAFNAVLKLPTPVPETVYDQTILHQNDRDRKIPSSDLHLKSLNTQQSKFLYGHT